MITNIPMNGMSGVQSDWSVNDSTNPAFVKNRPGGYNGPETVIYTGSFTADEDGCVEESISNIAPLVAGNKYSLTVGDETVSNLTALSEMEYVYIGSTEKGWSVATNTSGQGYIYLEGLTPDASVTVSICGSSMVKIPKRMLDVVIGETTADNVVLEDSDGNIDIVDGNITRTTEFDVTLSRSGSEGSYIWSGQAYNVTSRAYIPNATYSITLTINGSPVTESIHAAYLNNRLILNGANISIDKSSYGTMSVTYSGSVVTEETSLSCHVTITGLMVRGIPNEWMKDPIKDIQFNGVSVSLENGVYNIAQTGYRKISETVYLITGSYGGSVGAFSTYYPIVSGQAYEVKIGSGAWTSYTAYTDSSGRGCIGNYNNNYFEITDCGNSIKPRTTAVRLNPNTYSGTSMLIEIRKAANISIPKNMVGGDPAGSTTETLTIPANSWTAVSMGSYGMFRYMTNLSSPIATVRTIGANTTCELLCSNPFDIMDLSERYVLEYGINILSSSTNSLYFAAIKLPQSSITVKVKFYE